MWISETKPIYDDFIKRSLDSLIKDKLNKENSNVRKINDRIVRIQAVIVDLPAKAAIANIKQFNGYFGCSNCHVSGSYDMHFKKFTYKPISESDPQNQPKTFQNYQEYADLAKLGNTAVYGIKGHTCLSHLIDPSAQMPFDYMHLICAGHGKWIFKQYLDKDSDCSLYSNIQLINKVLKETKIPHIFNRRSIDFENSCRWKCSQIKLFLFYLCLPTLINILPNIYFTLLAGYVCAIRLLYEPIMDIKDLDTADKILKVYHNSL